MARDLRSSQSAVGSGCVRAGRIDCDLAAHNNRPNGDRSQLESLARRHANRTDLAVGIPDHGSDRQ
jgi:hypothetical protein